MALNARASRGHRSPCGGLRRPLRQPAAPRRSPSARNRNGSPPAFRNPQQATLPDGRATAPYLAQLIGQEDQHRSPDSNAEEQLRFRQQLAFAVSDGGALQARSQRGTAERRTESPHQSVAAYRRVAASSLAYATAKYGVVRDVEGLFVFNPGILDITA